MAPVETKPINNNPASQVVEPCTVVIFGASGDLTKRLLLPAIYNLGNSKLLSENFAIIGSGRGEMTDEDFRSKMADNIKQFATTKVSPELLKWFTERLYFVNFASEETGGSEKLRQRLAEVNEKHKTGGNAIFYFAVPPSAVTDIVNSLAKAGMLKEQKDFWRRLMIEKPFGHDFDSARALNKTLLNVADEKQIFRIDHYLGKESVQNIMTFRFANGIFEPTWNNKYIDNIQITTAESLGVEGRGDYYEHSGALRDMIQNHLFQMLALTTMDAPTHYDAESVRGRKNEIFDSIRPYQKADIAKNVIRGQYAAGKIDNKAVCAYRDEPSVNKNSVTETYVGMKVLIDNDRWSGVPIYLRTGKRLSARLTEIAVEFKKNRPTDFGDIPTKHLSANTLVLKIQPDEGVLLQFAAKVPGEIFDMQMLEMDCEYADYFGKQTSNGYETLLYDCLLGDSMLFTSADNVETNWHTVDPILNDWKDSKQDTLQIYSAGSAGPSAADKLLERDGKKWRQL